MNRKLTIISIMMLLAATAAQAQIKIGGNIYGGGNAGDTEGSTKVIVRAGDLNNVYGGARMANVGGSAFVNIDGEHASDNIFINSVYGGNDIAGIVGNDENNTDPVPSELTEVGTAADENNIDESWDAFIRTSPTPETANASDRKSLVIGSLFGGGNGDYDYTSDDYKNLEKPELGKTYLEILGGCIAHLYGGGNNATVTANTTICIKNNSPVLTETNVWPADPTTEEGQEQLAALANRTGLSTFQSDLTSYAFNFARVFGGNNKADMSIRPTWNLQSGVIRDLYSGGNQGAMTSPNGILLAVSPDPNNPVPLTIDNVFGGCRRADVNPDQNTITEETITVNGTPVSFPAKYAARVYITGGTINNVYGGNDISGKVYGGNAVGIHSSINGNVYGGGNGSYAYTDNRDLAGTQEYGDFYYEIPSGKSSVEALNLFRPNAEQVSIRVSGQSETKPTVIGGAIYCGGNSATLQNDNPNVDATAELKIGSWVYADNVFLGNNGEHMIDEDILKMYKGDVTIGTGDDAGTYDFSQINLTDATTFATYMDGAAMGIRPSLAFDHDADEEAKDEDERDYTKTYKAYSTYFGSLFVGGNVGSLKIAKEHKLTVDFSDKVVIFDKVVGGCNKAYINPIYDSYTPSQQLCAAYPGGVLLDPDDNGDKLELNFNGLKIQPKRWEVVRDDDYNVVRDDAGHVQYVRENGNRKLEWNTVDSRYYDAEKKSFKEVRNVTAGAVSGDGTTSDDDLYRRLTGGNVYGGCCQSGIVNGNVIININASIIDRDEIFDVVETDDDTGEEKLYGNSYTLKKRNSGVILGQQGMDVLGYALNVFGGGKGVETEIWGSTTINLNRGYVFQIFGGSEEGAIGKRKDDTPDEYGRYVYEYNPAYSTYVNLSGSSSKPGVPKSMDPKDENGNLKFDEDLAACEFMYGGGFEGTIAGNTHINLDNGRIFNSFAGSCNADIQGHTETYIGVNGFPYVRDYVYGGNDLGGKILGDGNFKSRVRNNDILSKVHGYDATSNANPDMLNASSYVEYVQGRVEKIFGGCYGVYDYTDPLYGRYFYAKKGVGTNDDNLGTARSGYSKPWMDNAFVNIRPIKSNSSYNGVGAIYGAGQGFLGEKEENKMQNRSYILIDIPDDVDGFHSTEVFGAGECGGVGMWVDKDEAAATATPDKASAIIDLVRGDIKAAYGGSYKEGITRRTVVNVPKGSTVKMEKIFGGAYGISNEYTCDVYESNVNWNSSDALVGDYRTGIYGGNNACRRTLYSKVNINAPVYYDKSNELFATVYGAGYGKDTWAQYTEVNLNATAQVYEVYGGGQLGRVMNKKSADAWKTKANTENSTAISLALENEYTDTGLDNALAVEEYDGKKYNTNVRINEGAWVSGYMYEGTRSGAYAYGGGLGSANVDNAGDVHGTTFIGLFGGKVEKDIYAAGTVGSVNNLYKVDKDDFNEVFVASTNAYIEGGVCRNVYGGGWQGSVGYHEGDITESFEDDIPGETHVVIGKLDGNSFTNGIPTVERNAFGGGEGGPVYGTANITLLNGYIGYRYNPEGTDDEETEEIDERYEELIRDDTAADNEDGTPNRNLYESGSIYGGGYVDNSSVDITNVKMYGGHVRNALFGGGEIAAVGRGVITASGEDNSVRTLQGIYKAGKTNVFLFDGYVHRNVFGGGRGYNWEGSGGKLFSDGYVFGQTEVCIHGGEVGTTAELANDNGNVFGGGDIGYVYSAYEKDGKLCVGKKDGTRYDDEWEGYYYRNEGGSYNNGEYTGGVWYTTEKGEYRLTEDCKVLVEPKCKVNTDVTINGHSYTAGDYVEIDDLNTLGNKNTSSEWASLDLSGIIIHNAVFAGGNTTAGSSKAHANATSVYGNATASIHDVYNRDLITIGTGHVGGLYGDGNLTFVDGYRGLNITNYGTDYYTISSKMEISLSDYYGLDPRERAYYELKYKCKKDCVDDEGTAYYKESADHPKASTLTADDILTLFKEGTNTTGVLNEDGTINTSSTGYWEENGVCTIYAGRIMNTIQRADFCGVFGSRMVLQGAQDRVPEEVDYTNYTINRVREVSLNKKKFNESSTDFHGNYFGIYNIVNYLGALTSDVDFHTSVRETDNSDASTYKTAVTIGGTSYDYGTATYEQWKNANRANRLRNNGTSHNKVALASGVYLELTTEKSTGTELNEKDWGLITGVVELDLINVQPGIGGGFVYAKNEHGVRSATPASEKLPTLTALNTGAVTSNDYQYTTDDSSLQEWETSGNFVHGEQVIIDDCYNISGKYKSPDAVPAHYWYIQGSVYVYDQYVSAYTGVPNAYSETVDIPLTITAASNGSMRLLNVKPNKYAYYKSAGVPMTGDQKIVINDVTYNLNDPISYWDWYLLSTAEKNLFVDDTYVVTADCKVNTHSYSEGDVLTADDYTTLRNSANTDTDGVKWAKKVTTDDDGHETTTAVPFDDIFRSSNNMSHEKGYILTYKVNNPTQWNTWYTRAEGSWNDKLQAETEPTGYNNGPTYRLKSGSEGSLLGQRNYNVGDIISEDVYDTYQNVFTTYSGVTHPDDEAKFEKAYIVTQQIDHANGHYYVGSTLPESVAGSYSGSVTDALICTKTIQLSKTDFIYINSKMTTAERDNYLSRVNTDITAIAGSAISKMSELTEAQAAALTVEKRKELTMLLQAKSDINSLIVNAYYCKTAGTYGGDYYLGGRNYRGLTAWSSMSEDDREKFAFNYDALDLLVDSKYGGTEGAKHQYDGKDANGNDFTTEEQAATNLAGYSLTQPVDYKATYDGNETDIYNGIKLENGKEYSRTEYENLPNEQRHFASISATAGGTVYVVNTSIQIGNKPYAVGSTITSAEYGSLDDQDKSKVTSLTFSTAGTYYYCRESYEIGEKSGGKSVSPATGVSGAEVSSSYSEGTVPVGLVIDAENYSQLINKQVNFTIHGIAPTETSTLYVSRSADIADLSKEKIITVIYEYNYEESDESGTHITPISERHVVNIHVTFKSGSPTVEDIDVPKIILPGDFLGLREPNVIPGATDVTGGGWELFEKEGDAESSTNGIPYTPDVDPLYWYQDGYWLKYYALSYIGGKTYSNKVQVSVANYHDLKKVIEDKKHHYYVDVPDLERLGRVPKIYINDAENGATQLKDLFDLSVLSNPTINEETGLISSGTFKDHAPLDGQVKACENLEFFLRTNISHSGTWSPIGGGDGPCFNGTFHGDGHYISGLDHSLFDKLCGNVYNLGVTGSFTEAGIANTGGGFVENCWVKTDATSGFDDQVMAVFGKPDADAWTHVVNCYYPEAPSGLTDYYKSGPAKTMKPEAFYNGTLAYDLNGFYLYKRYSDKKTSSGLDYQYYKVDQEAGGLSEPQTSYYGDNLTNSSSDNLPNCSSGYNGEKYVEDRYADGDFRYAGGIIPDTDDERQYVDTQGKTYFYAIWPDDYLFFGQMLTYSWNESRPHEEVPSPIVKSSGRLLTTDQSNRVYRAPAYYQNSTMDVAHFNPSANLVAYSKPKNAADTDLKPAYPNMTAIDFAGHNDQSYNLGLHNGWFYQPLLDDDGLLGIVNRDETPNLLVYAPAETAASEGAYANSQTYGVLTNYFKEPDFSDYYQGGDYKCVADASRPGDTEMLGLSSVVGHLVQGIMTEGMPTATNDHLLVDKQDFDCPIPYTFDDAHRMWYQRAQGDYKFVTTTFTTSGATTTKSTVGWNGVSLPFAAELVTTNVKGELTHFYQGSTFGHEYWLREYKGGTVEGEVFKGTFNYPDKGSNKKDYTNTFLWDYYYSKDSYKDLNEDTYQEQYYSEDYLKQKYPVSDYPYAQPGTPYLVGFPGRTYYEFDLSGQWTPQNRYQGATIESPGEQVITFVSEEGASVAKSDGEKGGKTGDGYTFKPSYLNQQLAANAAYVLNSAGSSYDKVGTATTLEAFRPYFVAGSGARPVTRSIIFASDDDTQLKGVEERGDPTQEEVADGLNIYAKKHKIIVESALSYTTDVRIVNTAGITMNTFTIEPGETVETRIYNAGVYIVQTADTRYTKKLAVR